jgi:aspartate racemase
MKNDDQPSAAPVPRHTPPELKRIGILAHSADGSALCYLEMVRESARLLGEHEHPEITLSILPMGAALGAWEAMDLSTINVQLRRTAQRLAAAGCDFFVCPDNTAHIALDAAREPYPLPGLHIGEIVAQRARSDGRKRVALLGTRWTMEGPSYPRAFARAGIEMRTPSAADRALLNALIFDELCQGLLTATARAEFVRVFAALRAEGCDAVALSCTEIPLLITPEVSPLPTLDSTRLLAQEAVRVALGHRPLPAWRGGEFQ